MQLTLQRSAVYTSSIPGCQTVYFYYFRFLSDPMSRQQRSLNIFFI